jgi:hypothetical protein
VLELYSLSFGIHFWQQWKGILFSPILNRREILQYHEQRVYRIIHVEGGLYLRFIAKEMINLNFVQDSLTGVSKAKYHLELCDHLFNSFSSLPIVQNISCRLKRYFVLSLHRFTILTDADSCSAWTKLNSVYMMLRWMKLLVFQSYMMLYDGWGEWSYGYFSDILSWGKNSLYVLSVPIPVLASYKCEN